MAIKPNREGINPKYITKDGGVIATVPEKLDEYNTTEKAVGKWVDGSTVYRKVITATLPTATVLGEYVNANVDVPFTYKDVIGCKVIASSSSGAIRTGECGVVSPNPEGLIGINVAFLTNGKMFLANGIPDWSGRTITVIVEYTKV